MLIQALFFMTSAANKIIVGKHSIIIRIDFLEHHVLLLLGKLKAK
jgi:hypothetical protein